MPIAVNPSDGSLLASVVSGGGTQYAEGATTSPGTGTLAIGRYNLVAPTLTDGELYGLQLDNAGNLKVTGSLSVGGTTDNSTFTAGTSTGTPAMGFYHSTIDTVTDGRSAAVAITAKRGQHANLRDSSGNELLGQKTMANSVPVTISSDQTSIVDTTSSGTISALNATVSISTNGQSTVGIQVTGSFTATLIVQGTTDGSTWTPTTAISLSNGTVQTTITGSFNGQANCAGLSAIRLFCSSYTSGTATVTLRASTSIATVMLDNPLPTGSNIIGAVTQSGTWTNTVTQATAANLNATVVGTGTFAVQASQSGSWTTSGNKTNNNAAPTTDNLGVLPAIANASSPIFTEGNQTLLSVDTAGNMRATVNKLGGNAINTGNGTTGTGTQRVTLSSDSTGQVTLAAGSNVIGSLTANQSVNVAQMNGTTVTMNNGVAGTGVQRVTLASDSTGQVAPSAQSTATGTAIYNNTALSNTKQAVNASAGNMYGYHIYNPNSSVTYVQLFNLASASVTVGTTTPTAVLAVPAGGWADAQPATPIAFGTALTIAATTTSTGSTAPTTALLCNIWYK